jgi:lysophospholipase L1-like esterase
MPTPTLFVLPTNLKLLPRKLAVGAEMPVATSALASHIAALQSQGILDLTALGRLPISGTVIPQPGILCPRPGLVAPADLVDRTTMFQGVFHLRLTGAGAGALGGELPIDRVGGTADVLKAKPIQRVVPIAPRPAGPIRLVMSPATSVLSIPAAYWAADEITIADNTMIVLGQPHHWLVMIANKVTLGTNVSCVWEQKSKEVPPQASPRLRASTPPQSTTMGGTDGADGAAGSLGASGPDGDAGPEIEMWMLALNRLPTEVLISGQDGFQGAQGQNGQGGQNGARGRDWRLGTLGTCASGPGNGGDGGNGGAGGRGGAGGAGGRGGRFSVFAPAEVLGVVSAEGFYIEANGGLGGPSGKGGLGGAAGSGGRHGDQRTPVGCPTDFGKDGHDGHAGAKGADGAPGPNGDHFPNAATLTPIKKKDFDQAFNRPAIYNLSAESARVGDTLTAVGKGFADTDSVYVGNAKAAMTFISDTLLSFVVPATEGGRQRPVQVRQQDGTVSNNATLQILPVILWIEQEEKKSNANPAPRFSPGKRVTIVGSGFSPGPTILVNDQNAADNDVKFESSSRVSFTLLRPHNVKITPRSRSNDPDVESAKISMKLRDDSVSSEPIDVILDTTVMVVFGDSIAWGQGLREDLKFHSLVEKHLGGNGVIGVYKTVKAHSGAVIGVGDNRSERPVNGEVPTSYPTVLQQVDAYDGNPALVDLVILDGGINDIGVEAIISPLADSNLPSLINHYCYTDMKVLLKKVTQRFPNAQVVVTGYFQIITDSSSLVQLYCYLMALGMLLGGPVAAAVVGGVSAAQKDTMVSHCKTFADSANAKLLQAVNDVKSENAAAGQNSRIAFAKLNYLGKNAIFADESWLWGLELDGGPADDVELGGVEDKRAQACSIVESDDPDRTLEIKCVRASVGHPNQAGAAEYARAIIAVL